MHSDEAYTSLLIVLGLERLIPHLHSYQPWSRILSPGEQQRLAAARAILGQPDFLFVDEATSALDAKWEATVYRTIVERLPDAAIISVAHRESVAAFHDTLLEIEDGAATISQARSRASPAASAS